MENNTSVWWSAGTQTRPALLANDTDVEFDPLSITAVSAPSVMGGWVVLEGGFVSYTPPGGDAAPDRFTYTVSDSHGASSEGYVYVVLPAGHPAPTLNMLSAVRAEDGVVRLRMFGIAGSSYVIETTRDLGTPEWEAIATVRAGPNGLIVVEDAIAVGPTTRFYRAVTP